MLRSLILGSTKRREETCLRREWRQGQKSSSTSLTLFAPIAPVLTTPRQSRGRAVRGGNGLDLEAPEARELNETFGGAARLRDIGRAADMHLDAGGSARLR